MKAFNYILSWALLVSFTYNLVGYEVVFRITHYQIKKEVKRKLKAKVPSKELHTIVIPKFWLKHNNKDFELIEKNEFRYKGEMYDIVRQTEKGDIIIYECISDTEETKLFAWLDEHIKEYVADFPDTEKRNNKLLKKITKNYFDNHQEFKLAFFENSYQFNPFTLKQFKQLVLKIESPPPRIA